MIPPRMKRYLDKHHIQYRMFSHERTENLEEAAKCVEISLHALAKAVLLIDQEGVFSVAMIPYLEELDLVRISRLADRPLGIVFGAGMNDPFVDCDPGSHPPIGEPYSLQTFMDISLRDFKEVYFEVGSHCCLVQVQQDDFQYLMADATWGHIIQAPVKHRSFLHKILSVAKNRHAVQKKNTRSTST